MPRTPDAAIDTDKLAELYLQAGWSSKEIADFLGCAQQTVRNSLRKVGIARKSRKKHEPRQAPQKMASCTQEEFPGPEGWKVKAGAPCLCCKNHHEDISKGEVRECAECAARVIWDMANGGSLKGAKDVICPTQYWVAAVFG